MLSSRLWLLAPTRDRQLGDRFHHGSKFSGVVLLQCPRWTERMGQGRGGWGRALPAGPHSCPPDGRGLTVPSLPPKVIMGSTNHFCCFKSWCKSWLAEGSASQATWCWLLCSRQGRERCLPVCSHPRLLLATARDSD